MKGGSLPPKKRKFGQLYQFSTSKPNPSLGNRFRFSYNNLPPKQNFKIIQHENFVYSDKCSRIFPNLTLNIPISKKDPAFLLRQQSSPGNFPNKDNLLLQNEFQISKKFKKINCTFKYISPYF